MFTILFLALLISNMGLAMDKVNHNDEFLNLIAENSIVGRTDVISDGKNLAKIKTYFERHKSLIDLSYIGYSSLGHNTALELACYIKQCSPLVVEFLCKEIAASGLKIISSDCSSTHCLKNIFDCEFSDIGLYQYQVDKLNILKKYCIQGQLLQICPSDFIKRHIEYKKWENAGVLSEFDKNLLKGTTLENVK